MGYMNYRCSHCGSLRVKPVYTIIESCWGNARFTIEGVPAEQCEKCGEKHLTPEVSEKLQELMKNHVADAESKVREHVVYA